MRLWLVCLLLLPLAAAEPYYADVVLDVHADGTVAITGISNHPLFHEGMNENLTSKDRGLWLLNLSTTDQFADFIIDIKLPAGATLNYANGKSIQIGSEGDHVTLKRVGSESSISILAQYRVPATRETWWYQAVLGLAIGALIFAGIVIVRLKKQQPRPGAPDRTVLAQLPIRQRQIMDLLLKAPHRTLTQKQLEAALTIPKSSVSRNVDALVRRGLIEKAQAGMTNAVSVHPRFR